MANKSSSETRSEVGDREAMIRERAQAIWEAEGRPEGQAEEHWRLAAAAVDAELAAAAPAGPQTAPAETASSGTAEPRAATATTVKPAGKGKAAATGKGRSGGKGKTAAKPSRPAGEARSSR